MQLALQLYTVRSLAADDMSATLEEVAQAGYTTVETAGYGNLDATSLRAALDQNNLTAIAAHVGYERLRTEFSRVVTEMKLLGCQSVVIPWIAPDQRTTAGVTELVASLNAWAHSLHDQGLRIGYHNHDFEFAPLDGSTMFERIATETDPEMVDLELDLGWIADAGEDPVAMVNRFAGRVPLLHAKDQGPDRSSVTAGRGLLPWAELIPSAIAAGCKYLIVENDNPVDPVADIHDAMVTLGAMLPAAE